MSQHRSKCRFRTPTHFRNGRPKPYGGACQIVRDAARPHACLERPVGERRVEDGVEYLYADLSPGRYYRIWPESPVDTYCPPEYGDWECVTVDDGKLATIHVETVADILWEPCESNVPDGYDLSYPGSYLTYQLVYQTGARTEHTRSLAKVRRKWRRAKSASDLQGVAISCSEWRDGRHYSSRLINPY